MSIAQAAQYLAAQGRGNDDQLVHMSGKEIAGLQALAQKHGLSMSTNPRTGLPEAFSLDSLLPMVAGIGLDIVTGGAATPFEIAMMAGAADALATHSLQKGLMFGLGAYGGAGMSQSISTAGASALADTPAQSSSSLVSDTPTENAVTSAGDTVGSSAGAPKIYPQGVSDAVYNQPVGESVGNSVGNPSAYSTSPSNAVSYPNTPVAPVSSATPYTTPPMPQGLPAAPTSMQQLQAGIGTLGSNGLADIPSQLGGLGNIYAAGVPIMAGLGTTTAQPATTSNLQNTVRPWTYTQTVNQQPNAAGSAATPYFTQQWTPGTPYVAAAGGGLLKGAAKGESLRGTIGALHGVERLTKYAQGGLSDLGSYSDGGQLLSGPGDGVSDSIPAQIGAHQPARLADSEFVIPARIVSELGNGSTDAGAKKLYQMIDRVQANRAKSMGTNKQYATDTKADRFLPA